MLKEFLRTPDSRDGQFSTLWIAALALACALVLMSAGDDDDDTVVVSQLPAAATPTPAF